jgi:hypothetical protein
MALSPVGRISFPNLGGKANQRGEVRHDVVLVFDKKAQESDKFKAMEEAIQTAAKGKFGDKVPTGISRKSLAKKSGYPITAVEESPEWYGWADEGAVYVAFSSKYKPEVYDADKEEIIDLSNSVYAGCHGRVSWTVYAYDTEGNKGVSFGLKLFQKTDDGEKLSGGGSAVNEIEDDEDF